MLHKFKQSKTKKQDISSSVKSNNPKIEQTCVEKYGFKNPQQNAHISEKASRNAYLLKPFIFPNGNKISGL